jgi:recombination protein RecT
MSMPPPARRIPMSSSLVTYDSLKATLLERQPQWSGVLPALLTPERFLNFALLALAETPRLFECTRTSLLAGVYQAAKDGLELGRDCYLVPFKARGGTLEATYIRDYKGIVKLLERTGKVAKAFAEVVYEGDICTIDYGHPTQPLVHQIALTTRGKALGCYGAIVRTDGTWHVHYMDHDDLTRVKQQAPGREQDPWLKHPLEMWRKTALKNVAKYCPLTPEVQEALTQEEVGEPAPVGAEQAQQNIQELFDRSTGQPEPVNDPA